MSSISSKYLQFNLSSLPFRVRAEVFLQTVAGKNLECAREELRPKRENLLFTAALIIFFGYWWPIGSLFEIGAPEGWSEYFQWTVYLFIPCMVTYAFAPLLWKHWKKYRELKSYDKYLPSDWKLMKSNADALAGVVYLYVRMVNRYLLMTNMIENSEIRDAMIVRSQQLIFDVQEALNVNPLPIAVHSAWLVDSSSGKLQEILTLEEQSRVMNSSADAEIFALELESFRVHIVEQLLARQTTR